MDHRGRFPYLFLGSNNPEPPYQTLSVTFQKPPTSANSLLIWISTSRGMPPHRLPSTAVGQVVACMPVDPWSGQVSWVRLFRGFYSPVRQMLGSFRPPRSLNIIWPSLSSIISHYGRANDLRCWCALKPQIYYYPQAPDVRLVPFTIPQTLSPAPALISLTP